MPRGQQLWGHSCPFVFATLVSVSAFAQEQPSATAQREPDQPLEEVVVSGFRYSLEAALDAKRDSAAAVDAIVAEDIADFPDLNLAESIQRIPGVAITRDAGEGRQLSVRGLGPDFTRIRINGMEALTTTGAADASGGVNRSRSFDFNVFASELFNSITVRKTAAAEVEEGSLGATVDLQTARPFDYKGFTFAASTQLGWNDLAENVDPRAAFLVSNTFANGKFGALLSMAYTNRSGLEEGHSTVRWSQGGANGGFNNASTLPGYTLQQINNNNPGTAIYHPRIPRATTYEHEQKRLGVTGSLQFQPVDSTLLTVDALYADYDAERSENYLEALGFSRTGTGKPQTIIRDGVVNADNELVYGVFDNVDMRVESRFDVLETVFQQYTGTVQHSFSDSFKVAGTAGYAISEFRNPIQTTITLDRQDSDGFSWDYRGDDRLPTMNWGFDPSDPAAWSFGQAAGAGGVTFSDIRIRPQEAENSFRTFKLDGEYQLNNALTVKAGIEQRKYQYEGQEFRRGLNANAERVAQPLSAQELAGLVNVVPASGDTPAYVVPDFNAFADRFNIYSNTGIYQLFGIENPNARGSWQSVEESEPGGFVQLDFKFELGVPLRGNIGVRTVKTELDSLGYALINGAATAITAENEYRNTLPSLNLVAQLSDELLLRFGAAKVVTRPGLGTLSPGGDLTIQASNRTYNTNNPFIDPTKADTLDLAAEWYFDPGSLLGAAVFYKDIGSFNSTLTSQVPYTALGLPLEFLEGTGVQPTDIFDYSRPVNGDGGKLKGFEINYQQPLKFLPAPWSGLGVLMNYTYVDSTIAYPTDTGGTVDGPLQGLSKNAANATLYYENTKFSVRGSVAYRAKYATRIPGREGSDLEGTNATINFDMAAAYNLTDYVRLTFEGLNLTDEYSDQYIASQDRVVVYQHTGRQFFLGARASF
jgi:iron complex outermembrane recepter protein